MSTKNILVAFAIAIPMMFGNPSGAQEFCPPAQTPVAQAPVQQYRDVQRTVYDQTPVKVRMQVNETVMETERTTVSRPFYTTETRERRTRVMKPVVRTGEREESVTVQRPVTETVVEKQVVNKTIMETVTVMQEEEYFVDEPYTEIVMETRRVLVKKPVTREVMRPEEVTAYVPEQVSREQLTPVDLEVQTLSEVPGSDRFRRRWLDAGYYNDPATGQSVYRKRGFHWVAQQPLYSVQTQRVPGLAQQTVEQVNLIPEKVTVNRPTSVTTIEEVYEDREVPVEVERTRKRVKTRLVPVEKQVPRTIQEIVDVPVTRTKMVDETITRKVPTRELEYEMVEYVEPYEQTVMEWKQIPRERTVEKVVPREVEVELIKNTPRTITMRVPVDAFGNPVGNPEPVTNESTVRFGDPYTAARAALAQADNRDDGIIGPIKIAEGEWQGVGGAAGPVTPETEQMATLIFPTEPGAGDTPEPKRLQETSGRDDIPQPAETGGEPPVSILDAGNPSGSGNRSAAETPPVSQENNQPEQFRDVRGTLVPVTSDDERFDPELKTKLGEIWRPDIPGRLPIQSGDDNPVGTGNASGDDAENAGAADAGVESSPTRSSVQRPTIPAGTPVFENAPVEPDARQAPEDENRIEGIPSLRERFPGATLIDDNVDAADLAPQIERRK